MNPTSNNMSSKTAISKGNLSANLARLSSAFQFRLVLAFFALLAFANNKLIAQTGNEGLGSEEVTVVKNFEAKLAETERIVVSPTLPPADTTTQQQTYSVLEKKLEVDYEAPKIRPIAMKKDALGDAYKGYFKLGAGLPNSFYGEGSYDIMTSNNLDLGIFFKHHSANNNSNVENQRFMENLARLEGTYYADQGFAVNARLGFESDQQFFYGYNFDPIVELPDTFEVDRNDVRQRFNTIFLGADVFNGERTVADFNYKAGFNFYDHRDNYAASEQGFDINLEGTKYFNEAHPLTIKIITDFTNYEDTVQQNLNNFYIQPSFTYHGQIFSAKLGANLAWNEDQLFFYPDVLVNLNVIGSQLGAFVGAQGDLQKNTFRSLSDYNPFVVSRSPGMTIANTDYYYYFGGVKGDLGFLNYRAEIGFKDADNLALFLLDEDVSTLQRRFNVVYDTATILTFNGSIGVDISDQLNVTGTVATHVYNLNNEEKPWHLPALEINGRVSYLFPEQNIKVIGDVFLENGVPYLDRDGVAQELNTLLDVSIGAEYSLNDNIGVFLQLNNLANNKRQRWQFYPTYGLNFLAGATVKF